MKKAVTSVLFQPLAFASGLRLPLTTGDVLSMLIPLTLAEGAALPGVVDAVAAVRDGLTGAFAADGRASNRVCRDFRLD